MNADSLDNLNNLVTAAAKSLGESQQLLSSVLNDAQTESGQLSVEEQARGLQLILEYRLSNQDALVSLLKLDKHLLYILGIQPKHSQKTNLERITYALGSDDLKHVLHALSKLLDHLLRIARRQQTQQKEFKSSKNKQEKVCKVIKGLKEVSLKNGLFVHSIKTLEKSLADIVKFEAMSPIYDHIAAFRGPISQFHQAILNGLATSELIYEQINNDKTFNLELDALIKKADEVLDYMPSLYHPQPNYSLGHFPEKTAEELEERAAAKRMRPFFN